MWREWLTESRFIWPAAVAGKDSRQRSVGYVAALENRRNRNELKLGRQLAASSKVKLYAMFGGKHLRMNYNHLDIHHCPAFPSRYETLDRNVACLPAECAFYMTQEGFQAAFGNQGTKPNIDRIYQDA